MKNKILSVILCICMLLPFCPQELWAKGTELNFSRYFSGDESDWEIYEDNTNLVVLVTGDECADIAKTVDEGTLTWYLKTNGVTYQVDPISYHLYGDNERIILRFPTFTHGFCPAVNPIKQHGNSGIYYSIDFSAVDKNGNEVYYGSLGGLHSQITDPVLPGVGTLNGSRYGSGMRVFEDSVTQITFTIKESIVQKLYDERANYKWMLSISDGTVFYYGEMNPTSCDAGSYLVTFEPCLAETPFIPEKNVLYYINLELWQDDVMKYFAGSTIYGYKLEEDPILGGEKHNVTFRVGDKEETRSWYEGQTPYYSGDTSIPSDSPAYNYVFAGWEPKIERVSGDAVYTATYNKVPATYEVTFVTDAGSVTQTLTYGDMPSFDGDTSGKTTQNGTLRLFTHWDKEFVPVTENTVYRAQYDEVAQDKALTVKMTDGVLYRGMQKSYVFSLGGGDGITKFSFSFSYDESRFDLKTATPLLPGLAISDGTITYDGAAVNNNTALFSVTLSAKDDAVFGKTNFVISDGFFWQGTKRRGYLVSGGSVSLGQPLSGDINKDTNVNTDDADALLSMITHKDKLSGDLADTNHDGKIDIRDAIRICAYLEGDAKDVWSVYDETKYTVTYTADKGGEIIGTVRQTLTRKQSAETVFASAYARNYQFTGWSDGKISVRRQDSGIEGNVTIVAHFSPKSIVLDLPEIHINTWDGSAITSNTEYKNGTICITGADDQKHNVTDLALQIRGRGNYLWDILKNQKPSYRIRLVNKTDLLGYGEERDWILLTTYSDVSLLRNYITWRLGDIFDGLPHSVQGEYVSLYLNGDYRGVYLLCERIEASRLELDDEDEMLDKDYLLELDGRAEGEGREGLDWFRIDGGQQPFVIKSQVNNEKETTYIKMAVTALHEALMSGDVYRIAAVADIDSIVDSYIVQEFGKDRDVGFASFFFYKKAGGRFYFTSPWDFDLGWGNDELYPETDGLVNTNTTGNLWFATLEKQTWFKIMVKNRMQELSSKVMVLGEELLAMGQALTVAALQDEARWNTIGKRVFIEPASVYTLSDYKAHYRYLYDWYMDRWIWLCDYFDVI